MRRRPVRDDRVHLIPTQIAHSLGPVLRRARPPAAQRPAARAAARQRCGRRRGHAGDAESGLFPAPRVARRVGAVARQRHKVQRVVRRPRRRRGSEVGCGAETRLCARRGRGRDARASSSGRRLFRRDDCHGRAQEAAVPRRRPAGLFRRRWEDFRRSQSPVHARPPLGRQQGGEEGRRRQRDDPRLLAGDGGSVREDAQDYDALGPQAHVRPRKVLALRKLFDAGVQGRRLQARCGQGLRGGVRDVQVARVASKADGQAADYLGLQDPLPRRALPPQRAQDHLRRRGPDRPRRPARALGRGPAGQALRLRPFLRFAAGDAGLPILAQRLLEGPPRLQAVPHLGAVRGGPARLSPHGRRRPAPGRLRPALARPEFPCQPGPGPAQLRAELHPHPLAAAGVALVRELVQRRDEGGGQDD
mmetsp:Transcript_27934/g.94033  ORF Transcript_27934/g.94033 Transcript_27934/m.94033 type:complete len:418 (+) Transcript_27934:3510-4763(+)